MLGVVAVGVATAVSLLRQPGVGALDTVWAEDGSIFLSDAEGKSTLEAVTASYAGYFHLVPRLLAQIAALVPPPAAAAVLAIEAALCTGLIALLVYVASAGHLSSRLARILSAAVVVVLPLGMGDLPNSIANLHWPGLYALFWMLIWTPRRTAGRTLAVAVVFLVACSDILILVFLPLALVRALRPAPAAGGARDRHGAALAAALLVGVGFQLLGLLTGASSRSLDPDPVRVATGYALRAVPPALLGERWLGADVDVRWIALAGLAWLLILGSVLVALRRITRPAWALAVVALAHSIAVYALPVLLTGTATIRYAAAPAMLLVTAIVAALLPGEGLRGRVPLYAFTALLAVVWIANLRVDNARAHGPRWSDEVNRAPTACDDPSATVELPIPPTGENPPWVVTLPCRDLRR